jgi:hypothetical protein
MRLLRRPCSSPVCLQTRSRRSSGVPKRTSGKVEGHFKSRSLKVALMFGQDGQVQKTWNSLGRVYFGFQSFQIGDRYGAAVDLEHSFCL